MSSPDDYRRAADYKRSESPLERKSALDDILRDLLGQSNSKAGQAVTLRTAMETVAVMACARVIAEGLAMLPVGVFRKVGESRESASDHPVAWLLSEEPNEWQDDFEFREQIGLHLALAGNAFVFVNRSASGRIIELLPYEPGAVTVMRNTDLSLSYRLTLGGGQQVAIPPANMWHIRGPSWNGYLGLDAVKLARNVIGLALATEEFGSALFANGARPGGLLTTEQVLNPETAAQVKAAWAAAQGGSGNAMKTALLSGGLKYTALSQTADEAQFIETKREATIEICRAMRVNPIMIMHNDNQAGYASVEQRYIAHDRDTLMPWVTRFEKSAKKHLFTMRERRDGHYIKLNIDSILRATAKERAEVLAIYLQNGVISRNEARSLNDWSRSTDPSFDQPQMAANLFGPAQTGE